MNKEVFRKFFLRKEDENFRGKKTGKIKDLLRKGHVKTKKMHAIFFYKDEIIRTDSIHFHYSHTKKRENNSKGFAYFYIMRLT